MPCLNEEGNVFALYEGIKNNLETIGFEIIYINDGSNDATENEILNLSLIDDRVKLVTHDKNLGIHASWKSGVEIANSDIICFIDADLQNPPEAIPEMLRIYEEFQADLVQGTRSSIGRVNDQRKLFSRTLNYLLNLVFRQESKDSKSGFILGSSSAIRNSISVDRHFNYFQTFIGVSARSKGYRVIELETLFQSRHVGNSFLSGRKAFLVLWKVLKDFIPAIREFRNNLPQERVIKVSGTRIKGKNFLATLRFEMFFLTMPLHKWIISKKAKKYYLWLKSIEYSPKNQLENLQMERLQALLNHAYNHVPYYKRTFDQLGVRPNEVKNISDIKKLPLLSKNDVRKNLHFSLFSSNHNKKHMHRINTSGSTGEPFVCYADKFQLEVRFATTLRALEMTGWRFGDKQLRLWHQTLGMSKVQVFKEKIDAWFMKRTFIPAFEMTEDAVEKLVKKVEKLKPMLIDGYAESLNFIAQQNQRKLDWSPIGIMSSAQELTDKTRNTVEDMFGTKIYDKYGSREFSGIAYQCRESAAYHVQDESYLVEILVDGREALPGEIGEIVITDLNNFSTPMIRYRIGDLAIAIDKNPCKCGRPHSQIGRITGRTQAIVGCANGVWLPGTFFAHFFKDFDFAIKHYQVVQRIFGSFIVKIVPNVQFNQSVEKEILVNLIKYTGIDTEISIELVDSIPLVRTGKRTPVISHLKLDFQSVSNKKIKISKD